MLNGKQYEPDSLKPLLEDVIDKTVLIMDADMRRPSLHKIFPKPEVDDGVSDDSGKKAITALSDSRKPGLSELLKLMNERAQKRLSVRLSKKQK